MAFFILCIPHPKELPHMAISASMLSTPAREAATIMMSVSRWRICANSCARTPASSSRSSKCKTRRYRDNRMLRTPTRSKGIGCLLWDDIYRGMGRLLR